MIGGAIVSLNAAGRAGVTVWGADSQTTVIQEIAMLTSLTKPRGAWTILAFVLLALVTTNSALAGHDSGPKSGAVVGSCDVGISYAQQRFDTGYRLGKSDGWSLGLRDGSSGRAFCGQTFRRIRYEGIDFRRGYWKAFREAYAAGFEEGRRTCRYGYR